MSAKKTPSAPKTTQADRAAKLGISVRTLREWEKAGVSETEMRDRAARQKERAGASSTMSEARLRKLRAEAELKELELAKQRGELISIAEVLEGISRIGAATRSAIMRMEADLPPMLEGLPAAKMQLVIRQMVDQVLGELSDQGSKLTEPEV
jgi:DNA-binding transcriptional regulator YiaG